MPELFLQRCSNHAGREAVARCPECGRFFCRECIAEHEERVLCAACLKKLGSARRKRRSVLVNGARFAQAVFGFMIAWFFFFLIGEKLVQLPDSFHAGTLWSVPWEGGD